MRRKTGRGEWIEGSGWLLPEDVGSEKPLEVNTPHLSLLAAKLKKKKRLKDSRPLGWNSGERCSCSLRGEAMRQ